MLRGVAGVDPAAAREAPGGLHREWLVVPGLAEAPVVGDVCCSFFPAEDALAEALGAWPGCSGSRWTSREVDRARSRAVVRCAQGLRRDSGRPRLPGRSGPARRTGRVGGAEVSIVGADSPERGSGALVSGRVVPPPVSPRPVATTDRVGEVGRWSFEGRRAVARCSVPSGSPVAFPWWASSPRRSDAAPSAPATSGSLRAASLPTWAAWSSAGSCRSDAPDAVSSTGSPTAAPSNSSRSDGRSLSLQGEGTHAVPGLRELRRAGAQVIARRRHPIRLHAHHLGNGRAVHGPLRAAHPA